MQSCVYCLCCTSEGHSIQLHSALVTEGLQGSPEACHDATTLFKVQLPISKHTLTPDALQRTSFSAEAVDC